MAKDITFKVSIVIDGEETVIQRKDYSDSITEHEEDNGPFTDEQALIDHIADCEGITPSSKW